VAEPGFPWPRPQGSDLDPAWDGKAFSLGGKTLPFLSYQRDQSTWDQGLTDMHEAEAGSGHFIDRASREQAAEGLRRWAPGAKAVLEVGVSSGFLLPMIRQACPQALVIGADCFPESLARIAAEGQGFPLLEFDLVRCPLPDACLDAVVLLNVLEHIKEDAAACSQLHRILKPGGVMLLEVPAGPGLYDAYDHLLHHHRRYALGPFKRMVRAAGFDLLWANYMGVAVYPGFALVKKLNQWRHPISASDPGAMVETVSGDISRSLKLPLARTVMRLERLMGRVVPYPFGIRCLLAARKKG